MYDVHDYDAMFADPVRTGAHLSAISRAVQPGSVVVEIGTGVGFFAVAACRAGARRVYAIESNPAIELAADVARDNGCADRITFIHADSRHAELPEPADVLLSDLRGVLPLHGDHIPTLVDARTRLIRPEATIIPRSDTLWVAPCAAPAEWRRAHGSNGDAAHGINRRAVAARVRSDWYRCHLSSGDLAAPGVQWARLDYATIESPSISGRAEWRVERDGSADGIAIWFEGDLGFGATIANSPCAPRALYGQAFFPLERPVELRAGDCLAVELTASYATGEYLWGWNTTLTPAARGAPPVEFRQSNLAAHLVSLGRLRKAAGAARDGRRTD